jgi:phosphoglycerate dehydrogenase-like enzyme
VVTRNRFLDEELEKIIRAGGDTEVRIKVCKDRQEFQANLKDAEVVFGHISGEELNLAPKLKWVQYNAAGVNFLMEDQKFRESPVVLTNQAGTFAPGISETAIGLLLCLTRGITKYYMPMFYRRALERVGTPASDHHIELAGKTMAIVGMGGIGSAVARRAHYGFDMRIIGIDAKPLPRPDYVEELHDPGWFPEMVPQADVLVAAAPQTPETQGMFSEKVFRSMKRTSYFLGLSRGDLFDDMALVRALKEGWIAGAGLDVFPQEPPPSDHPIYDCSNVVMTPHTSGWGPDRQVRFVNVFAENIRRYATGLPLMNVVDKKRMY